MRADTSTPGTFLDALAPADRAALVDAGEQWTGMRADVFVALAGNERPASAYDIADAVTALRGKRDR